MKKDVVFISRVIIWIAVILFFYIPFMFLYIKSGNTELAIISLICIFLFLVLPAKQKICELERRVELYIEKHYTPIAIKYTARLIKTLLIAVLCAKLICF